MPNEIICHNGNGGGDNCNGFEAGFKEIYKEKKDYLSYATFQFGTVKFPAGVNKNDTLYFQPIATRKNDLRLIAMEME